LNRDIGRSAAAAAGAGFVVLRGAFSTIRPVNAACCAPTPPAPPPPPPPLALAASLDVGRIAGEAAGAGEATEVDEEAAAGREGRGASRNPFLRMLLSGGLAVGGSAAAAAAGGVAVVVDPPSKITGRNT